MTRGASIPAHACRAMRYVPAAHRLIGPTGASVRGATGGVEGLQELDGPLGRPAVLLLQALEVSAALGPGLAFLDGLGVRIDRLDVQAVLAGEGLERAL